MRLGPVRIGTSGWQYKHWVGPFYPPGTGASRMLPWYTHHFDAVEVNNSFYRLPSTAAVAAWCDATPKQFLFAIKASRFITHMKKLKDPAPSLARLVPVVDALGPRRGPVLFQLPPHWSCDLERLATFLTALPHESCRYAFELRDQTWLNPRVYDLLARHRAALCVYDLAGFQSPIELTTSFAYVRLHGPGGKYQGSYSDRDLGRWADRIAAWRERLSDGVFVFFDNDQAGFAAANALSLRRMVGS